MFLEIAIILVVLWLLGVVFFPLGGLIHIILVVAVIALIWHFVTGGKIM